MTRAQIIQKMFTGKNVIVKQTHPAFNRLFEDMTTSGEIVDFSEPKWNLVLVKLERTDELRWFNPDHLEVKE